MLVVMKKWNFVDSQGKDGAVFVRFYYCENCQTLVQVENVGTNGTAVAHHEKTRIV